MSKLQLFFSPKGAIGRAQYWGASIVLGLCLIVLIAVVGVSDGAAFSGVLFLPALWSSFAITAKRLHDRGKSGWYWVLFIICSFIPFVSVGVLLWAFIELGCMKGTTPASALTPRKQKEANQLVPKAVPALPEPRPPSLPGRKAVQRLRSLPDTQETVDAESNAAQASDRNVVNKPPAKKRAIAKKPARASAVFYEAQMSLQEIIDNGGDVVSLIPNEYNGPVVIRRDCEIDGRNSAIVAQAGAVVRVEKGNVVLRNLCIEVLDEPNTSVALKVSAKANLNCESVTISGCVSGRKGESGSWKMPKAIHADYPNGKAPAFTFSIEVPVPCELDSRIVDLDISPRELSGGGQYNISCKPREVRDAAHYCGDILIRTPQLVRRIPFTLSAQPLNSVGRSEEPRDGEAPSMSIGARQSSTLSRRVVRQDMKNVEGWIES